MLKRPNAALFTASRNSDDADQPGLRGSSRASSSSLHAWQVPSRLTHRRLTQLPVLNYAFVLGTCYGTGRGLKPFAVTWTYRTTLVETWTFTTSRIPVTACAGNCSTLFQQTYRHLDRKLKEY